MERSLDVGALQARLREIAVERDWTRFHTPKNLAMALAVEVAELVEIFQWMTAEESAALSDDIARHVADELADVTIYLARLADVAGIDIASAVAAKLDRDLQRRPGKRGWENA